MSKKKLSLDDLNVLLISHNARWQAKENYSKDMQGMGYTPGPDEPSLKERESIAVANLNKTKTAVKGAGSPASFDWRNNGGNNYITPVKNVGACGACVAFSTIGAMEALYQISKNTPDSGIDLSEAQVWYCYGETYGVTCETGWWPPPVLNSLKQGIATEACFPYVAGDQDCSGLCNNWADNSKKISGWHSITDADEMKEWLSTKGPLVTVFTMYEDFYYYTSGIYHYVSGGIVGGDSICVVGYSDEESYWICKQQWTSEWGESGYFRIAYGQCGIDAEMWAIEGVIDEGWLTNKLILGLWTIDQDRNAWVYVDAEGWKKISNDNDNIFIDMLSQLISAKASGKTVSIYIFDDVITQIYVNS